MKIGLSTLLFVRSSIEESVKAIAALGSDLVEIVYDAPHFTSEKDRDKLPGLKEIIDSAGLDVTIHGSFWDLNPASHHHEVREISLKQAKLSIEACRFLGGAVVILHPGRIAVPELESSARGANQRYLAQLKECLAFAKDRGVRLSLENINFPYYLYPSIEDISELIENYEGIGLCLDIAHAYRYMKSVKKSEPEVRIAQAIKQLRRQIVHVHIHDNHGESDEHLIPGDGSINFEPIVAALKATRYSRMVAIELFDLGNALETGRVGLERVRKHLRQ